MNLCEKYTSPVDLENLIYSGHFQHCLPVLENINEQVWYIYIYIQIEMGNTFCFICMFVIYFGEKSVARAALELGSWGWS